MIRLSKASKMPCQSWSLQAIDTCPASRDSSHPSGLVAACRGCYATQGNYRYPNVKAPRIENQTDWKRDAWVSDMVTAIGKDSHFRWFDSGDCYQLALAEKILAVMKATPHCRHWLPTRMHKFPKFGEVFKAMNKLRNAVVRFSSDSIHGDTVKGQFTSTIFDPVQGVPPKATPCEAYTREGKCQDCRACWSKAVPVIAYPQHGRSMARVNLTLQVQS